MSGEIKAGRGSLIGNAGEYYVVAELLKRGVVAAMVPRNTPSFDILAAQGTQSVRIRVKTKSERWDDWQWVAKPDGTIFRDLEDRGDFTVLVNLALDRSRLAFFVVPTKELEGWLSSDFDRWLSTPGKRGQRHSPDNKKRNLSFRRSEMQLKPYADAWHLLWEHPLPVKG